VVWRSDPHNQYGDAGTDVFDLSCANAQRLFSTPKKDKRREKNISPHLELPIANCQLRRSSKIGNRQLAIGNTSAFLIATVALPRWDFRLRLLLTILG
jgi:hypothetical protein